MTSERQQAQDFLVLDLRQALNQLLGEIPRWDLLGTTQVCKSIMVQQVTVCRRKTAPCGWVDLSLMSESEGQQECLFGMKAGDSHQAITHLAMC